MDRGRIKVGAGSLEEAGIPVDGPKFFAALKAAGTPSGLVIYPEAGRLQCNSRPDNYRKADAETAGGACSLVQEGAA
jgi:hypothetical protein